MGEHKDKAVRVYLTVSNTKLGDAQVYYEGTLNSVGDDYVLLDKAVAVPFTSISYVKVA